VEFEVGVRGQLQRSQLPEPNALRRKLRFCIAMATLLCVPPTIAAQTYATSEYQVKVAFLFKFGMFFEWPPSAAGNGSSPFVICMVGEDTLTEQLGPLLDGKSIEGHPAKLRQIHRPAEGRACQIIFITKAAASQTNRYLDALANTGVLTVGEVQDFCTRGGILNFWTEADHIRFEINPKAAESVGLRPSSKLLQLARVVGERHQNPGSQ
jgi:hypothetical protein